MALNPKSHFTWRRFFKKLKQIVIGKNLLQVFLRIYILIVLLGAVLLWSSWTHSEWTYDAGTSVTEEHAYTFWDALFVSCSAFSNTGLTPLDVKNFYNTFGQFVVFTLIGLGGIGIVSLFYVVWNFFKKNTEVRINHLVLLQSERGSNKYSTSFKSIRFCVIFIILVEILFGFIMSCWICFFPVHEVKVIDNNPITGFDPDKFIVGHGNYIDALWQGMFFSVSAMNNAGFDLLKEPFSLAAFRNDWNIFFQMMVVILIILGGIGYPLIFDIYEKIRLKKKGVKHKFTLFTKICLVSYFLVLLVGLGIAYGFEFGAADKNTLVGIECHDGQWGHNVLFNKIFAVFFNTVSTRSAGFSTFDQYILTKATQTNYSIMMFIGANPSSTGGGIRTTTLAIVFVSIWHLIRGHRNVTLFKKTIPSSTVKTSFIVCFVALILVIVSSIAIDYSPAYDGTTLIRDQNVSLLETIYEVTSAFGTVGLSMGLTYKIGAIGKAILIINMFIGQLGVSTALLVWFKKMSKSKDILYPTEDVKIG